MLNNDISCDFESPQWDRGQCGWFHTFESTKRLTWTEDKSARKFKVPWKYGTIGQPNPKSHVKITTLFLFAGNHYTEVMGTAKVKIATKAQFHCDSLTQANLGFLYKLSGGKVNRDIW